MSSSRSSTATSQATEDARVAGDNGAIGISADGPVSVHVTADEAFELGVETILAMRDLATSTLTQSGRSVETVADTVTRALTETQQAERSETTQLAGDLLRIGIPAAALAYVAARVWR